MTLSASNSIIVRLRLENTPGVLSKVTTAISECGGDIGAIDIISAEKGHLVRDVTVFTQGHDHAHTIVNHLEKLDKVELIHFSDRTFLMHIGGKIKVESKVAIKNRDDLSMAYTPGVARVCEAIHADPEKAHTLTIKHNTVAIVSDGTAVLGLGDIGPRAAMPVMEGKAMLFKDFGDVDAFPICLDTKEVDEVIRCTKNIAPGFGGINLEDISSPRCFEIEKRLQAELDIPVFHDDQHGTAIVLTAAFINALKIIHKKPEDLKVIVNGVGAAGVACTHMMQNLGIKNIIGCDRTGAIYEGRDGLDAVKSEYAQSTNPNKEQGSLQDVIKDADVFVGLSAPNVLSVDDVKAMKKDPIVFAMANPTPEIMPEVAAPYVAMMATGRSDYPNQINNVLAFPGIFRGALDCRATCINDEMKLAAAHAIANVIPEEALAADYIIPSVFDGEVVKAVAEAVMKAARQTNVARKP
jgi:malate dehydrogenase (oxaloacetate-decarboxylating)